MKEIFDKLINSFDNEPKGFSSKKLTAFILVFMTVIAHVKWFILGDFSQLEMVLTIDYAFIASLFGMTTYQAMKTQTKSSTSTTEEQINDETKTTIVTNEQIGGEITHKQEVTITQDTTIQDIPTQDTTK